MICVPIGFVEDVLLALNFYQLREVKLLTKPWTTIARTNIDRRAVVQVMVDCETGESYARGRQFRATTQRIPFDSLDFRFVTNVYFHCTQLDLDSPMESSWSKVSLQQVERLISKRACKTTEEGSLGELNSYNEVILCCLSESADCAVAKTVFRLLPLTNRLRIGRIEGFERELGDYLTRLGPLYEVSVVGCTGITSAVLDHIIDNFTLHPTLTQSFTVKTPPLSDAQLVRLIDKCHAFDDCECLIEVRLESETPTMKELMEIYDFAAHFSHITCYDTDIYARKGENAEMELEVELRQYSNDQNEIKTSSIIWHWRTKCEFRHPKHYEVKP